MTPKNTHISGNISVTRNADIGALLTAHGNVSVKGNLAIDGWLDAKHVRVPCKGLFPDVQSLTDAFPVPAAGWWALVGTSFPAEIYCASGQRWVATGETGGEISIDLHYYDSLIQGLSDDIAAIEHPVEIRDTSDADFVIADEQETPIVTFADGHIRTALFDSANITAAHPVEVRDTSTADLIIADDEETPIVTFKDGHIHTALFDSANITAQGTSTASARPLQGKTFSVIGDSISSFAGTLPAGYWQAYPMGDVADRSQQWWAIVEDVTGATLLKNCSSSGSDVCGNSAMTSGNNPPGCSTKRISDVGEPDIVIVLLGTNDWGRNRYTLGEWSSHSSLPAEGEITVFAHAYALMVHKLISRLPSTRIVCCTLFARGNANASGETFEDFNKVIADVCRAMGVECVDLNACGIRVSNASLYTIDGTHPNKAGFALIGNAVSRHLLYH